MTNGERRDREIRDEIAFHLSEEQEEREAYGAPPTAAGEARFGTSAAAR